MSGSWRHPGRIGAVIYAVLGVVFGGLVGLTSRLQVARQRGRTAVVRQLPEGAIIVISNHTSYADGVLLALACRRQGRSLRLLATAGVFRVPVLGWLGRRLGFVPVARGSKDAAASLDAAAEALSHGEAVGLYPEGRLTRDPAMWPERAKTGAVRLALRSGAPIVPVAMVGAHEVVGRRRILVQLVVNLVRRPRVDVSIGEPIDALALAGGRADVPPEIVRTIADTMMGELIALVAELRGEAPEHPTGVPHTEPTDSASPQ